MNEYDRTWCSKLLADLTKWSISSPFRMPVDPIRDGAPNYPTIVKHPMDFQTMKKKLSLSEYTSVQQFIDDIQLVCDNAKLFNGPASIYGLICDDIMTEVHKQYSQKSNSVDEEWYKSLHKAVQDLETHLADAPVEIAAGRTFKAPSNLEKLELSAAQREALINIVGTSQTEVLTKKWAFLNESAKDQILSVIDNSMES
jgi:hypothetical protein